MKVDAPAEDEAQQGTLLPKAIVSRKFIITYFR